MSIGGVAGHGGLNPAQFAAQFFKKADANGDGGIDKAEFKKMLSQVPDVKKGAVDLDKVFSEIDTDGSGKISQAENQSAVKKMVARGGPPGGMPPGGGAKQAGGGGESSASTLSIDPRDTNGDGKVSLQEALAYAAKQYSAGSGGGNNTAATNGVSGQESPGSSISLKV